MSNLILNQTNCKKTQLNQKIVACFKSNQMTHGKAQLVQKH